MTSRGLLAAACLVLSAEILVPLRAVESVALPAPDGPYSVGTRWFELVDHEREETWTPETGDPRRLMVQIWYPSPAPEGPVGTSPYVPARERLARSLERYWPGMPSVETHAVEGAPFAMGQGRILIVFSHGMNSCRSFYTALLEELASHGYVAAAVDHTYWGPGVAFPDGFTAGFDDGMTARDTLEPEEIDRLMLGGIGTMSQDQGFVAAELIAMLGERLDRNKIVAMGHSMGGMAAARSCQSFTAIKACISIDGHSVLESVPETPAFPCRKPFLLVTDDGWPWTGKDSTGAARTRFASRYLEAWSDPEVVRIKGATHRISSDMPFLDPSSSRPVPLDARRAHDVLSALVLGFLRRHLDDSSANGPGHPDEAVPEAVRVDLESLTGTNPDPATSE